MAEKVRTAARSEPGHNGSRCRSGYPSRPSRQLAAHQPAGEPGMTGIADIGAAVIGTGFIGTVHVEALRRIGVQVRGVLGSTPERGAARADGLGVARAYASLDDLLADPTGRRRPRHLAQRPPPPAGAGRPRGRPARRLREAAGDDRGGVARAGRAGRRDRARQRRQLQHPLLPAQPARPRGRRRRRPRRRPARDRPLLPGLAAPRHRLELAAPAGARRGAAGGRRHRLALARPDGVRHRPAGRRRSWPSWPRSSSRAASRPGRSRRSRPSVAAETVDPRRSRPRTPRRSCCASRTAPAARSASARSAPGRKNSLQYEIDGSDVVGRLGLRAARPDLARPSRRAQRDPDPEPGADGRGRPCRGGAAGRPRRGLRRHVRAPTSGPIYADVAAGGPSGATRPTRRSPTATTRCSSTTRSPRARGSAAGSTSSRDPGRRSAAATRGGARPMRLGLLTAPFPETPLDDVVDWTAANGFESIEIACWPRTTGPTRRYAGTSTSTSRTCPPAQATEIVGRDRGEGPRPSPASATTRTRSIPIPAHRAEVIGHLKHVITAAETMDVPFVNTFMGGDGAKNQDAQLGGGPPGLAGHRRASPTTTAGRSPSRTARCCSATTSGRAATTSRRRRGSGAGSSSSGAARSGSTSTRRT